MGTVDLSVLEDLDEGAGEAKEEKKETTGTTLLKKTLVINGAERMFVCNTEKDSLANVLRRLGLTGTKIGCGKGQCGACSVILNGKVVRSCMRKIKSIADYSEVETIEGLGTASNLHPLQLAWIKYGGVQCGFCTPGFIVSAKQLLAENPNPSRDEVRAWFQKHHNICRCTGYKPIVDCVMAAAEVMRGEKPREALEWKLPEDGRIYNTGIPRPAALAKVLGTADYGDDIAMKMPENTLHLALVLPGLSHANIKGIDFSEAEKAAGVFKVVTAADVKGINRITWPVGHPRSKADGFEHPILMDKKVFRYGDPVAVVCADTREHAREAAKLVKLDLEPLPEYDYATDAMQDDAMEIHPGIPNVFVTVPVFKGEDAGKVIADKSKTEYVVEGSFSSSREPHLTIEPDVAQAYVDANGVVTVHCKSLALHLTLGVMAAGIGVTADKIRVIENPTGASFGYTMSPTTPAIVAVCALATGHPVTLTCDYEEHMHFTGKRAPSFSNGKMGCDKDGNLTGLEYEIVYDKGAYTETAGMLLPVGLRFFGHPYYFPNVTGLTKCAFSNHAFSTAYRGFGSPQTYTASEQLIDMLAEKAGIDPWEFRYRNVYKPGQDNNSGQKMPVYTLGTLLDMIKPKYEALKKRAEKLSTDTKKRGVGLACAGYNVSGAGDRSEVGLKLNPDNTVTAFNCWEDQGQGSDVGTLVHAHESLRPLGLRPDQIHVVQNDTNLGTNTGPAGGSRSHYMAGNAYIVTANLLMDAMRKPDGTYRTYDEMVEEDIPTSYISAWSVPPELACKLDPNTGVGLNTPEYNFGVYAVEVEVDTETGKVKCTAMNMVADCGVIGNRVSVDGQAFGGNSHCIGFALTEDYYDVKKHVDMISCGIPSIEDIPDGDDFTVEYLETPRPSGPHGSSGCSEMFQSAGHVAVINAINDAVGVRVYQLPATPDKILAGLSGKNLMPDRFYLGGNFEDVVADIKANPV